MNESHQVTFRIDSEAFARLQARAEQVGKSVGVFVRDQMVLPALEAGTTTSDGAGLREQLDQILALLEHRERDSAGSGDTTQAWRSVAEKLDRVAAQAGPGIAPLAAKLSERMDLQTANLEKMLELLARFDERLDTLAAAPDGFQKLLASVRSQHVQILLIALKEAGLLRDQQAAYELIRREFPDLTS